MDLKSLDVAIKDFNEWEGPARINYNKDTKEFSAQVFHSPIDQAHAIGHSVFISVFEKRQFDRLPIGKKRKAYIIKFAEMLEKGYSPDFIEYNLIERGIYF